MGGWFWGRLDTCICMAKSLHCSSETITTLLICYIPIQMVLVLKKIKKHSLKNIYFLSLPLALFTICECMCISHLIMWNTLWPQGLQPASFLCRRDSPGKNTGVSGHPLLQGIFLIQASNLDLLHCRQIIYHLSHQVIYSLKIQSEQSF